MLCELLLIEATIESIFEVVICSLLHDLGILEALDELQFFLLHKSDLGLLTYTNLIRIPK